MFSTVSAIEWIETTQAYDVVSKQVPIVNDLVGYVRPVASQVDEKINSISTAVAHRGDELKNDVIGVSRAGIEKVSELSESVRTQLKDQVTTISARAAEKISEEGGSAKAWLSSKAACASETVKAAASARLSSTASFLESLSESVRALDVERYSDKYGVVQKVLLFIATILSFICAILRERLLPFVAPKQTSASTNTSSASTTTQPQEERRKKKHQ